MKYRIRITTDGRYYPEFYDGWKTLWMYIRIDHYDYFTTYDATEISARDLIAAHKTTKPKEDQYIYVD